MSLCFALDQNFPTPIVKALQSSIPEVAMRPIYEVDPRLSRLEDWALILALHHHADGFAGLITTDARMMSQPQELAALQQTKLSLVVAEGSGHDPVKATGLLLTHLSRIAGLVQRDRAQIWSLSAHTPAAKTPRDVLSQIAAKGKTSYNELFAEVRLNDEMLARNPLARSRT